MYKLHSVSVIRREEYVKCSYVIVKCSLEYVNVHYECVKGRFECVKYVSRM